jgi:hypothetical protein
MTYSVVPPHHKILCVKVTELVPFIASWSWSTDSVRDR